MPLIIMCGLPSSGKSTRTKELCEYFVKLLKTVHVISESDFINKDDKNNVYLG
jgi:tRNA uridine 5-carbamoylmethylation protein Kti12